MAPGERVGIVGPSGGGKSTLTRLVLRFMDVTAGEIRIDGQSIREVTQQSLRRQISYVPQDPQMLHRSIAENIWLGEDGPPDLERIIEVSRAAHVHEFVADLPDGYRRSWASAVSSSPADSVSAWRSPRRCSSMRPS